MSSSIRCQFQFEPLAGAPYPWVKTLANEAQVFTKTRRLLKNDGSRPPIYAYQTEFEDTSANCEIVVKILNPAIPASILGAVVRQYRVFDRFQRGKPWVGQSLGYYFVDHPDRPGYYRMVLLNEFIPGQTLGQYYDDKESSAPGFAVQLVDHTIEVFRMCQELEAYGLAHMDFKLDNIMVREGSGELVLIDFALFCGVTASSYVGLRTAEGTYGYMAPEVYSSSTGKAYSPYDPVQLGRVYKPRADVWSASMSFLEIVTEVQYLEEVFNLDSLIAEEARLNRPKPGVTREQRSWDIRRTAMLRVISQENIDSLREEFQNSLYHLVLLDGLTFDAESRPSAEEMIEKLVLVTGR